MRRILCGVVLLLLVIPLAVLARPEIEMPNASTYYIYASRMASARRIGDVAAWRLWEIPVRDLRRPRRDCVITLDLPGLPNLD